MHVRDSDACIILMCPRGCAEIFPASLAIEYIILKKSIKEV